MGLHAELAALLPAEMLTTDEDGDVNVDLAALDEGTLLKINTFLQRIHDQKARGIVRLDDDSSEDADDSSDSSDS